LNKKLEALQAKAGGGRINDGRSEAMTIYGGNIDKSDMKSLKSKKSRKV
jgi:hypothetical protein